MADLADLGVAWLLGLSALVAAGVAAERALPAAGIIWARQLIGVTLILAGVVTAAFASAAGTALTVPCARAARSPGQS